MIAQLPAVYSVVVAATSHQRSHKKEEGKNKDKKINNKPYIALHIHISQIILRHTEKYGYSK